MLSDQSGPRDWMPKEMPAPAPAARRRSAAVPARRTKRPLTPLLLSLVFGAGAVVLAVAPLFEPGSRGFILSTVGVTAIGTGIAAWRMRSSTAMRVLAAIGVALGIAGSVGMIARAASVWTPYGSATSIVAQPAPRIASPSPTPTPSGAVATPVELAGTLVYLIETSHQHGWAYPSLLTADSTGMVVTPAGPLRLPTGDSMAYVSWPDHRGYDLQVNDATGTVARYTTSTGVVTPG